MVMAFIWYGDYDKMDIPPGCFFLRLFGTASQYRNLSWGAVEYNWCFASFGMGLWEHFLLIMVFLALNVFCVYGWHDMDT